MYVSSRIVALYMFTVTLASFLVIFSFANAYAGKKRGWLMQAVFYALIVLQIGLDIAYYQAMSYEIFLRENPVPITADIASSMNNTFFHIIALGVTLLAIILLPVYHKWLLKLDTSIEDEEDVSYGTEQLEIEEEL
jgi:sterol desaturase/sphingolipid hydroxylase (fatty acid hydroxylase superfamily)